MEGWEGGERVGGAGAFLPWDASGEAGGPRGGADRISTGGMRDVSVEL